MYADLALDNKFADANGCTAGFSTKNLLKEIFGCPPPYNISRTISLFNFNPKIYGYEKMGTDDCMCLWCNGYC